MGQYKKNEMEEVKASIESLRDEIQTLKIGVDAILNIFVQMKVSSPVANSIQTIQNPEFLKEVEKATTEMLERVIPQLSDAGIGVATLQASPQPSTYSFHDCVFNAPVVCGSEDEHYWECEETTEGDDDCECESDEECNEGACTTTRDENDNVVKQRVIRDIHALTDDLHYRKVTHYDELTEMLHFVVLNPERYYFVKTSDERYAAAQTQNKTYLRKTFNRIPPLEQWSAADCMDSQNIGRLAADLYTCISRDFAGMCDKCSHEAVAEIAIHLLSKIIQVIRCKDIISPPGGDDD